MQQPHELDVPSAWVCRFAALIRAGGSVLDIAAGSGRHARHLSGLGYRVEAVDRDTSALRGFAGVAVHTADLEDGPWPFAGRHFDAVVVVNYLHRPLLAHLPAALADGGVLIYETFAAGNERYGRPRNPDFLLKPGELLDVARGRLRVVAYEHLYTGEPRPSIVQRLCAVNDTTAL